MKQRPNKGPVYPFQLKMGVSLKAKDAAKNKITWVWARDAEHAKRVGRKLYPELLALHITGPVDCPEGGDVANRCADCAYVGDYEFWRGDCRRK